MFSVSYPCTKSIEDKDWLDDLSERERETSASDEQQQTSPVFILHNVREVRIEKRTDAQLDGLFQLGVGEFAADALDGELALVGEFQQLRQELSPRAQCENGSKRPDARTSGGLEAPSQRPS